MRRRWRILAGLSGLLVSAVALPIGYIEVGCGASEKGVGSPAPSALLPAERRAEARTFLTYPEWHIVYAADSFARHLARGAPPSSFAYGAQIGGFWSSYCAVNRVTQGSVAAGDAKLMIYTIGISFTAELAIKAAYERTLGHLFEWSSGWHSAADRYAAAVQARYGAFMHQTPWYRFPFGSALSGLWRTHDSGNRVRQWERKMALGSEYGVKALYARALDSATGATVGRDELTLRFVARATPPMIRALDPRLTPIRTLGAGNLVVEAPRYEQFNMLLGKLARARVPLVEIAGNRTIFVTMLLPPTMRDPADAVFSMAHERAGWRRVGVAVPVATLTSVLQRVPARGGIVEHVYDY